MEQRELAHPIVKAYALGAHEVIVQWTDDVINRETSMCMMERLDNVPEYKIAEMNLFWRTKLMRLIRSSLIQVP